MQITQAMASNLSLDEIEWTSEQSNYRKQACIVFVQRRACIESMVARGLSIFSCKLLQLILNQPLQPVHDVLCVRNT